MFTRAANSCTATLSASRCFRPPKPLVCPERQSLQLRQEGMTAPRASAPGGTNGLSKRNGRQDRHRRSAAQSRLGPGRQIHGSDRSAGELAGGQGARQRPRSRQRLALLRPRHFRPRRLPPARPARPRARRHRGQEIRDPPLRGEAAGPCHMLSSSARRSSS